VNLATALRLKGKFDEAVTDTAEPSASSLYLRSSRGPGLTLLNQGSSTKPSSSIELPSLSPGDATAVFNLGSRLPSSGSLMTPSLRSALPWRSIQEQRVCVVPRRGSQQARQIEEASSHWRGHRARFPKRRSSRPAGNRVQKQEISMRPPPRSPRHRDDREHATPQLHFNLERLSTFNRSG